MGHGADGALSEDARERRLQLLKATKLEIQKTFQEPAEGRLGEVGRRDELRTRERTASLPEEKKAF